VVDVGCGIGYVVRALAAHGRLGRDVQLVGCDMNRALIGAARALADEEHLDCDFRVANAFALAEPAHVFLSTGVLHHFRGAELTHFFAGQREAQAFVHHDTQPSPLAPLGSWIFHRTRMREPLARHDGVVSAARSHSRAALLAAGAASGLACRSFDGADRFWQVLLRPMHAIVGVRPELLAPLERALGPHAARLGS
jgi:SAM-dependent methyltransferase